MRWGWLLSLILLAACGGASSHRETRSLAPSSPVAVSTTFGEGVKCFRSLALDPLSGNPPVSFADAEARARQSDADAEASNAPRLTGTLGYVIAAYPARIIASGAQESFTNALGTVATNADGGFTFRDPNAGKDVWVLYFQWLPTGQRPGSLPAGFGWRATYLIGMSGTQPVGLACKGLTPL